MGDRRDGTDAGLLFQSADKLKENPQHEDRPCRQPNPSEPHKAPSHQKPEPDARKIESIERNYAGNAAACADARRLRARIESNMREITNERRERDEQEIAKRL